MDQIPSVLRLGDLLVQQGALTPAQRDAVLREQQAVGRPFGVLAEMMYGVSPRAVERAWARQCAQLCITVDPRQEEVDPYALSLIDRRQAWQFRLLPLRFCEDDLLVCTTSDHLVRALRFSGWRIEHPASFVIADPIALGEALQKHFPLDGMTPQVVAAPSIAVR